MIGPTRSVTVVAFADELVAAPELVDAWTRAFNGDDDITLVVQADGWSMDEVAGRLGPMLAEAERNYDGSSADVLAVSGPIAPDDQQALVDRCGAIFGRGPAPAPFAQLRQVDDRSLSELRDLLPAARLACSPDGLDRVSAELRDFVNECPNERRTILEFMLQVAAELQPGLRVLDVGAGEQPYRELFGHVEYLTTDWANSMHPGARGVDFVAPADNLPIASESFDAVLSTQVLEHVADPAAVLRELHRVLVPGGRIFITLPLAWELHEEPFDFYRYTRYGISHLLRAAGFTDIDARPRNDCFTTLAQLMRNTAGAMGRAPDGLDETREEAARMMRQMSDIVQGFAGLDTRWVLPLGYAVRARRPF